MFTMIFFLSSQSFMEVPKSPMTLKKNQKKKTKKKKKKKQKIKKPENPPKKKKTKKNQKKQLDRYESGSSAPSRVPFLDHCYSSPGLSFFFSYFLHKDCHESNNGVCSLFTTFSAFQL